MWPGTPARRIVWPHTLLTPCSLPACVPPFPPRSSLPPPSQTEQRLMEATTAVCRTQPPSRQGTCKTKHSNTHSPTAA
eukprot:6331593-Ditylum_brightwellii.AAC.1